MKKALLIFLVSVLALFTAASTTLAEKAEKNILLILDASGSMKDKMSGKLKIIIAKEILSDLIDELPADVSTGLLVYGNALQNSCQTVNVAVPVKKMDREALKKALRPIEAKGKTPIAFSLQKGADLLKALPGEKALILISDGEETCGGNPLATAEKIRRDLGIDVVIHVVGFDVDAKTRQQLLGIANAGGGKYYSADNAAQLKESLVKIKEEVVEKKPPALPPPPLPAPEPPKELLVEEFNQPTLSKDWEIVNADSDSRLIDNGRLIIIPAVGAVEKETVKNMLLYKKEDLPENYDVILKYKTEVKGYWSNYSVWGAQMSGIVLYLDKDNYMYLVSKARVGYDDKTQFWFVKVSKAEKAPDLMADIVCKNPDTFTIKIEKRKFKYTGFVEFNGPKGPEWKELGSFTILGKKFYPGIISFRMEDAKEVTTEFDSFKINEVK